MAQIEVETQPRGDDAVAPGRFACPSCGAMLRVGAILCPYCDADLWTMAHGGPAPSPEAESEAVAGASIPVSPSADGRLGRGSLVLAAVALGAKIVLWLTSAPADGPSWLWSLWGWVTTLMAVVAIYMARRAEGRIPHTSEARRSTAARYALVMGMASIAFVASMIITWSIDQVVGNLHP